MTVSLTMMIGRMGAMIGNLIFPYLLKQGCAPTFFSIGVGIASEFQSCPRIVKRYQCFMFIPQKYFLLMKFGDLMFSSMLSILQKFITMFFRLCLHRDIFTRY